MRSLHQECSHCSLPISMRERRASWKIQQEKSAPLFLKRFLLEINKMLPGVNMNRMTCKHLETCDPRRQEAGKT